MGNLIDPNSKNFFSWNELVKTYNINETYLNYYSLISAIPNNWKKLKSQDNGVEGEEELRNIHSIDWLLDNEKSSTKFIYNEFACRKCEDPFERFCKWKRDIVGEISYEKMAPEFVYA